MVFIRSAAVSRHLFADLLWFNWLALIRDNAVFPLILSFLYYDVYATPISSAMILAKPPFLKLGLVLCFPGFLSACCIFAKLFVVLRWTEVVGAFHSLDHTA